ncbi:MAG TPA: cache domain-containing protein [Bryobacteraceae bacterium]|nr:cache domain-containing protein [Bryobacteraceae bacterium]
MPPDERFEFRISFRKLLVGLALALVPISVAGLYSITRSHESLESTVGTHFKTIAESTAEGVSRFVHDRVIEVALIAADSAVLDAVQAANRAYQGLADAETAARIEKIDKIWNTPSGENAVREVLASRASASLRRRHELDPRILRITVTDAKGAVVAASHKTLDYYQADEEYWRNIYADGRGSISLTDILYDEATKTNYIGVGIPVLDTSSGQFLGTVDALVDASTLFPIVNRVQLGPTGRTLLVRNDGYVISSPQTTVPVKVKSEEYAALQENAATMEGRESGYLVSEIRGRRNLIGYAQTDLNRNYRNLGWTVVVTQETTEAFAAVRTVERLIAFMSLLGLAAVTFVAVYFASHRKAPFTEIGELREPGVAAKTAN